MVTDKLAEQHSKRMPHPGYSSDISPCDFFLFCHLKDKLIDKQCATPKELFDEMALIISEIPNGLISRVFVTWQEKSQKYCDIQGNYIE
jgi:hypothetical protein